MVLFDRVCIIINIVAKIRFLLTENDDFVPRLFSLKSAAFFDIF